MGGRSLEVGRQEAQDVDSYAEESGLLKAQATHTKGVRVSCSPCLCVPAYRAETYVLILTQRLSRPFSGSLLSSCPSLLNRKGASPATLQVNLCAWMCFFHCSPGNVPSAKWRERKKKGHVSIHRRADSGIHRATGKKNFISS